MKNLTPEMIEKAKAAKSAEELLSLAKENNIEMTADEAAIYFAQLNPGSGELDDDEHDAVAGGSCFTYKDRDKANQYLPSIICEHCGTTGQWELVGQGNTLLAYKCCNCTYCMTLQDDEDFSTPHFNGTFYNY